VGGREKAARGTVDRKEREKGWYEEEEEAEKREETILTHRAQNAHATSGYTMSASGIGYRTARGKTLEKNSSISREKGKRKEKEEREAQLGATSTFHDTTRRRYPR
jgi:hypothetical protein